MNIKGFRKQKRDKTSIYHFFIVNKAIFINKNGTKRHSKQDKNQKNGVIG